MRPQLREGDDAFVAVERPNSNGWCRICRGGQEKVVYSFPPTVGDVDVKGLEDQEFDSSVWRGGDCGGGAGGVCCRGEVSFCPRAITWRDCPNENCPLATLVLKFQELPCNEKLVPTFDSAACAFANAPLKFGTKVVFEELKPNLNGAFRRAERVGPEAI